MGAMARLLLIALLSLGIAAGVAGQDRPNILWISCEDISPHLGCFDDPYAITPNLDRLAEKGTRFTNVYMSAGVCAPVRSTLITGMYQNSIGTHHMRCTAKLPDWLRPFPLYLREAGYYCTNNRKTDYQFNDPSPGEIWDESSGKAHWKNGPDDEPFFAVFNYTGCHESGIASESKYRRVTESLSEDQRQDPDAFENLPPYYPGTPVVREDWKRNYELITAMDQWAGGLIDELKEAGEWEDTIVMFWSDHGIGLPRAKRWLYDSGSLVPFILRIPERFRDLADVEAGAADERLVSSVDFAPTVLRLAGIETPDWVQGQSFLGTDERRDYAFGARDRMDERYDIIRTARDERYRYIRNFEPLKPYYQYMNTPEKGATMKEIRRLQAAGKLTGAAARFAAERKPVEELYDTKNDPHEVNNLADDPAHREKREELASALTGWQLEIGDLGLIPESEIERVKSGAGSDYAILHGETDQSERIETMTRVATKASSGPEAIPELRQALGNEDAAVRYWGATGLGNFAEEAKSRDGMEKALRSHLDDESPAVRIAAARALCRMGHLDRGLEPLKAELAGDNEWARLEAAIVLDELDEDARPALEDLQAALEDQPNKYIVRVANKAVNDLLGTDNEVR